MMDEPAYIEGLETYAIYLREVGGAERERYVLVRVSDLAIKNAAFVTGYFADYARHAVSAHAANGINVMVPSPMHVRRFDRERHMWVPYTWIK